MIIILSKVVESQSAAELLDIVKNIFRYINTESRPVVEARLILLNNESVTAICTQELLQRSHSNDIGEGEKGKDLSVLPLTFFDWRGLEQWNGRKKCFLRIYSPSCIKIIEEIHNLLLHYIIGEDSREVDKQESVLGLNDMTPPINLVKDEKLSDSIASRIREQFRNTVMQGVCFLLENFLPYKKYISEYRKIEKEYTGSRSGSDIKGFAFQELLYGNSSEPKILEKDVKNEYSALKDKLYTVVKSKIGMTGLLNDDIGMRGVFCAFGKTKKEYDKIIKKTSKWLDYSKWFTNALNEIFNAGWLDDDIKNRKNLFLHITHDSQDRRVNYRFDHVNRSLSILIEILILKYGKYKELGLDKKNYFKHVKQIWDKATNDLENTLIKGYRAELLPEARKRYPDSLSKQNEYRKNESSKRSQKHIEKLETAIEL